MTVDVCYGGCGGIWFDADELGRVDARGAATLHTVWQVPPSKEQAVIAARLCPRCPNQVLDRQWFSDLRRVEIDKCPTCGGIWLDAGEFTRIREETSADKLSPPGWAMVIAAAAAVIATQDN